MAAPCGRWMILPPPFLMVRFPVMNTRQPVASGLEASPLREHDFGFSACSCSAQRTRQCFPPTTVLPFLSTIAHAQHVLKTLLSRSGRAFYCLRLKFRQATHPQSPRDLRRWRLPARHKGVTVQQAHHVCRNRPPHVRFTNPRHVDTRTRRQRSQPVPARALLRELVPLACCTAVYTPVVCLCTLCVCVCVCENIPRGGGGMGGKQHHCVYA